VPCRRGAPPLLCSFPYGPEFLRLNHHGFEAYCLATDGAGVRAAEEAIDKDNKDARKARDERSKATADAGGYLDDMDLPPSDDGEESDDEGEGDEGDEEEEEEGDDDDDAPPQAPSTTAAQQGLSKLNLS